MVGRIFSPRICAPLIRARSLGRDRVGARNRSGAGNDLPNGGDCASLESGAAESGKGQHCGTPSLSTWPLQYLLAHILATTTTCLSCATLLGLHIDTILRLSPAVHIYTPRSVYDLTKPHLLKLLYPNSCLIHWHTA